MMMAVVPLVGTWIEIQKLDGQLPAYYVVPLVGTWIEMLWDGSGTVKVLSRSSRRNVD